MTDRVLVAGIGNIFFTDDGFGPAVVEALLSDAARWPFPAPVRVVDYGIRGMHLSYDLLAGVGALVLVDAVPPGTGQTAVPGALVTLRIGPRDIAHAPADVDAHSMSPVAVLAGLAPMGGEVPTTYLVGCIPADVSDGMGLSEAVRAAVAPAADLVHDLVGRLLMERESAEPMAAGG